jgi:hypothetical protein
MVSAMPAHSLYVKDMCGGTPSDGAGMSCPPGDYLLIRPLFSDGTCGDWACCPKNAGGPSTGYNCEQGVPPTRGAISSSAKKFLGSHVTIQGMTMRPSTINPSLVPQTITPVQRRGVDAEPVSAQEQETTGAVESRGLSRPMMPGQMAPAGKSVMPGPRFSALTKAECTGLGCKAVSDNSCPDVGALRERCICKAGTKGVCIDAVK